jgi:hypothetical protein
MLSVARSLTLTSFKANKVPIGVSPSPDLFHGIGHGIEVFGLCVSLCF